MYPEKTYFAWSVSLLWGEYDEHAREAAVARHSGDSVILSISALWLADCTTAPSPESYFCFVGFPLSCLTCAGIQC